MTFGFRNFFRRSGCYNPTSIVTTFRSEINQIIRRFDYIQIMFYYYYGISKINQSVKDL